MIHAVRQQRVFIKNILCDISHIFDYLSVFSKVGNFKVERNPALLGSLNISGPPS